MRRTAARCALSGRAREEGERGRRLAGDGMVPCWDGMSTLWVPFVGSTDCAPSRPPDAMGHAPDSRARCALSGPARERGERGRPLRLCRGGGGASLLRVAATIPFLIPVGAAPDVVCGAARTSSVGLQHKLAKRSSAASSFHANDVHALWRGCLHNAALLRSSTERSRRSDGGRARRRRARRRRPSRRRLQRRRPSRRWADGDAHRLPLGPSHPLGTIPSPPSPSCLDPQPARPRACPTPQAVRRTAARCALSRRGPGRGERATRGPLRCTAARRGWDMDPRLIIGAWSWSVRART